MFDWIQVITLLIAIVMTEFGETARILCIFPLPSISHQFVFRGLTSALHEKGHDLVIITTDPLKDPSLKNYTEIDLHFLYDKITPVMNYVQSRKKNNPNDLINALLNMIMLVTDLSLSLPVIQKLYEPDSRENFDLIIIEVYWWFGFYPIVKRFDAPWIGVASFGLSTTTHYALGNPLMPSHPSSWELGYEVSESVSFWRRVKDYINLWRRLYHYQSNFMPQVEKLARKHFGDNGSSISEIENDMSMILVNRQSPISFVRPNVPKVVEFGGFHVAKETKPLPKDLKEFLDGAIEGFVYMSLGSNVKSSMLTSKMRQDFISAFAKLPYKVLWKNEEEFLLEKPDNIQTMKWVPQQSVLAHPNIKVFIYQGGLQSTEEAIHHAVPLIGFPVLADQDGQILKMVSVGVCKQLEITDFTANELFEAIMTVATDPSYKKRMLDLRSRIQDRPYDPLENAVWWVEYVIRHGGLPHLQSSTADLPWYQRGDADIVVFITTAFLISLSLLLAILYRLFVSLFVLLAVKRKEKSA